MNYFELFQNMKTKQKNTIRFVDNKNSLLEVAENRFIWAGYDEMLPPVAPSPWLERQLLKYGAVCVVDINGHLTFCPCTLGGGLDKRFGTPTRVIYYTNGGKAGDIDINDTVVCFNNARWFPTYMTINRFANMLAETDKSIDILTIFSRLLPMPIAETDNQKKEIENAIDDVIEGENKVIKSAQLRGVESVNLLDPDQIKNMECLSRLHDELIKRACSELGLSITTKDKGAQLSIEELDSFGQYDAIKLFSPYNLRREFVKKVNEKYGLNGSVTLNPIFDNLENGVNKSKEELLNGDSETPEQETTADDSTPEQEDSDNADKGDS